MTRPVEHVVFSDESRHTQGRFRSIAAISLPASPPSLVVDLSDELSDALQCGEKGELKWLRVGQRGKRNVPRAKAGIDFLLSHLSDGVRVDAVIWDTADARHAVEGRDDVANYERMFFHLHRALMGRRESASRWHVRPDRLSTSDWATIRDCLDSGGTWRRDQAQRHLDEEFRWIAPKVATWREEDSASTPFVQLADLMAGMAAYTRTKAGVVKELLAEESTDQMDLLPRNVPESRAATRTDEGRLQVVSHLYQECKARRLGVSLRSNGYLRTYDGKGPVNFWHYEPQHPRDKAPTKASFTDDGAWW